jgi:hypothetical protein
VTLIEDDVAIFTPRGEGADASRRGKRNGGCPQVTEWRRRVLGADRRDAVEQELRDHADVV